MLNEAARYYYEMLPKLKGYGEDVKNCRLISEDVDAFAMIFNNVTRVAEILLYYQQALDHPPVGLSEARMHDMRWEYADRMKATTKSSFVDAVSSIEFAAKRQLRISSNTAFSELKKELESAVPRVYLSNIIKTSEKILDIADYEKWQPILYVRNCVVHNHGLGNSDEHYLVEDVPIIFEKEKPLTGNMVFFPRLTEIAAGLYYRWLLAI